MSLLTHPEFPVIESGFNFLVIEFGVTHFIYYCKLGNAQQFSNLSFANKNCHFLIRKLVSAHLP